jgi:polyisoprenoid-binding protein YceI
MPITKTHGRFFLAGLGLIIAAGMPFSSGLGAKAGASSAPVRYRLDPARSRFMVKVFVGGLLKAFGHDHNIAIRDFAGEITLTPDSIAPASLQMTIKADSLALTDKVSESDRRKIEQTMREEVLETQKYPNIVFKSTNSAVAKTGDGSYDFKVWGELIMHGVTGNGYIVGKLALTGNTLRATGGFPLYLSDYKLKQVAVAGGSIKVKNEMKFSFDLVAQRQ